MSPKHKVRDLGLRIAPRIMRELLAWRSQRLIMRSECKTGRVELSNEFCDHYGASVLRGPFRGMIFPKSTQKTRNLIPKIVGSYESELYDWLDGIRNDKYAQIVNVGSADGYYSVGLALNNPRTRVLAFDTDPWARRATSALALENGARNVVVLSMCTPAWLADNLTENSLILADCEGYEAVLLDPDKAPTLRQCDILVETHEHPAPGVEMRLRDRFAGTHSTSAIVYREKNPGDYPELALVPVARRSDVISEGRHGPQTWLRLQRVQNACDRPGVHHPVPATDEE
jgi:hypothetical protein